MKKTTTLAAVALLAVAAILMMMVSMGRGSPGDMAYASDPGDDRTVVEADAREARRAARAGRVESGEMAVVQAGGLDLATKAIDLPAVQAHCRTVSYNYDDCVTAHVVIDALRGDCTDCRTLGIYIFYSRETGRVARLSKTTDTSSLDFGSLENMGFAGVIPPIIGDLTGLEYLDLSSSSLSDGPQNQLTGPIPPEIGNLTSLEWLDLGGNQLTGSIPSQIGNLTSLETLWLYANQLTGPIPPVLGNLSNLTHLALSSNQLTGQIPPELGKLTSLEYLSIDFNQLTGCVPANLRAAYEEANGDDYPICQASPPPATPAPAPPTSTPMPAAQSETCGSAVTDRSNTGLMADCSALLAARDTLRGTAALNWAPNTSIASWDGITLGGSPRRVTKIVLIRQGLNGQIPAALGRLEMLEELWLYTNELSGSIPPEMGDLGNLRWLFVSDNNLSGQIPETLNNLTLDRLWLHSNNFTGCVPYNLTLTREYKVDRGLPACAQQTGGANPTPTPPGATPTPAPPGTTPTPTPAPTGIPVALDSSLTWHIHCQADDFVAAFGGEYVMDDERTFHYRYDRNGRGLWHVLRTVWRSPSSSDRSVACMTKVYDNVSSAIWDHQYTAMLEEALGGSDVLRQHKRCCKEIGDRFRGLMLDIGSTFSDGTWQDTLTAKSGVASFLREQVVIRIASYDRSSDGDYHLLEVDEMARRVNSRFYEGIFDEIETRRLNNGAGAQASPEGPVYLNPFSQSGE